MPTGVATFDGFGPDALAFLAGLEADNSKKFFDAHRTVYDEQVRGPLRQLCLAVGDRLAAGPAPKVEYEPKVGRSMFRINRDLRFSKDPTPYHPYLDLAWWQGDHPKTSPAFIMRIRHDELLTGVGVFSLSGERLGRYRSSVMGDAGIELEHLIASVQHAIPTASLSEPTRKRVPKGFDADHPRSRYLLHDGLHVSGIEPLPDTITTGGFAGHVADRLGTYADLHRWLVEHA